MGLLDLLVGIVTEAEIESGVVPPEYVPTFDPIPTPEPPTEFHPFLLIPGGITFTGPDPVPATPEDPAAAAEPGEETWDITGPPVITIPGLPDITDLPGQAPADTPVSLPGEETPLRPEPWGIDITLPEITWPEFPDIFGGLADLGKAALIGGAILLGLFMLKGK